MGSRQTLPRQWLIIDTQPAKELWAAVRRLPRGSGVLLLKHLRGPEQRRLCRLAAIAGLTVLQEDRGDAARVHDVGELRRALLARTPMILVSPIHRTSSHSDWRPLPRQRAAALARLAKRKAIALGGMNQKRYAKIAPLGFIGWAGIGAWSRR